MIFLNPCNSWRWSPKFISLYRRRTLSKVSRIFDQGRVFSMVIEVPRKIILRIPQSCQLWAPNHLNVMSKIVQMICKCNQMEKKRNFTCTKTACIRYVMDRDHFKLRILLFMIQSLVNKDTSNSISDLDVGVRNLGALFWIPP